MQFLFDRISAEAALRPDVVVLEDDATSLTWRDLRDAIANVMAGLHSSGARLGLLCSNSCNYVVAQLAAAFAGVTLVPLPQFFSDGQLADIVRDAGVDAILAEAQTQARARRFDLPVIRIVLETQAGAPFESRPGFRMVIYTSGSTGAPKGVIHGEQQLEAAVRGLASACAGGPADRYLSVLPLPMLLETICAIFLPIFCSARIRLATATAAKVAEGRSDGILPTLLAVRPSAIVLVPQLLKALLFQMKASRTPAPEGLRFVAVGGASVPPGLLKLADEMQVPVYEGYGLSECCSVVTLNRAGAAKSGTAGRPLDGVTLRIEDGEIVVECPGVMEGYLGGPPVAASWRTGDLGSVDADGFVTIHGRKDNLIVTSFGRNISPEWVESALMADPRIAIAVVSGSGQPSLHALIIPSDPGEAWFAQAASKDIEALAASLCRSLPNYAVPAAIQVLPARQAAKAMLVTANGRPIRRRIAEFLAGAHPPRTIPILTRPEKSMAFHDRLTAETAAERNAFLHIPIVAHATVHGAARETYLAFLEQAYHHVRHTFPLLALAASRTGDEYYQDALVEYMEEERGHEKWILDDIRFLGGDADAVAKGEPGQACAIMIGYAYYAIEHVSPYAMLGSVHVLEGLSVMLADKLADVLKTTLGLPDDAGFSYLRSHGALDQEHVAFFRDTINGFKDRAIQDLIIAQSKIFYRLYGNIFQDIGNLSGWRHAA